RSNEFLVWPRPWNIITAGQPPAGDVPAGSKKVIAIWTPSLIVTFVSSFVKAARRSTCTGAECAPIPATREPSRSSRASTGCTAYSGDTIAGMDTRPVGVFDSGVGGLTVLHECLVTLPHEDFVYLGDHARLPYGPRPLAELRVFAREIGIYLERQGVKLVVAACNAATSAALPQLQEELSVPVVGLVTPAAH